MIIVYIGGIGSGKTLSVVREILKSKNTAFTNFKLKHNLNYHRLKLSDIMLPSDEEKSKKFRINWEFWEAARKQNFSIYLDEVHNLINSRQSMSGRNIALSIWISQIRKILSDSKTSHCYLITQNMRKLDVNFRDLAQVIILCNKFMKRDKTYILQTYYNGIDDFEYGKHSCRLKFLADPYFKYYDTNELISFGDSEEYI